MIMVNILSSQASVCKYQLILWNDLSPTTDFYFSRVEQGVSGTKTPKNPEKPGTPRKKAKLEKPERTEEPKPSTNEISSGMNEKRTEKRTRMRQTVRETNMAAVHFGQAKKWSRFMGKSKI